MAASPVSATSARHDPALTLISAALALIYVGALAFYITQAVRSYL